MPEILEDSANERILHSAYESIGAAYAADNTKVEVLQLRGSDERDTLGHLVKVALKSDKAAEPLAENEYQVRISKPAQKNPEIWQVTSVRDPSGWFNPSDEKYFGLYRELQQPDPATGYPYKTGELQWTNQAKVLRISNERMDQLSGKPNSLSDAA